MLLTKRNNIISFIFDHLYDIKFIKFITVGITNTIITLAIIYIMVIFAKMNYLAANCFGYCIGLLNSYILNKYWTFKKHSFQLKEVCRFLLVFIISYFLQFASLWFFIQVIYINMFCSQILSMGIFTLSNYLFNKIYTF